MEVKPRIGVLALQGNFEAHRLALEAVHAKASEVRSSEQLENVDALIIPGGESSTMLKLLQEEGLFDDLAEFGQECPIFGTCAGAILLASHVENPAQASLGLIDMSVQRNGYGRQIDSRIVEIEGDEGKMEAVFIRAPIIQRVGPQAQVLAFYQNQPVLVEQGLHMAATFHPELARNNHIHRKFVEKVKRGGN